MLHRVLFLLAVTTSALGAQTPAVPIPDSPAGTVFKEWLRVVNLRDTAQIRAYAVRYEAERPDDPASVQESFDNITAVAFQSAPLRVVALRSSTPERLEMVVVDSRDVRLTMFFEVAQVDGAWRVRDIGLRRESAAPGG